MRLRGLAILAAILAIATAAYLRVGKREEADPGPGPEAVVWTGLDREEIGEIVVERSGEAAIRIVRDEGGSWRLVEPIRAEADPRRIAALLDQVAAARAFRRAAGPGEDLSPFGLDRPEATLTLRRASGDDGDRIRLGGRSPVSEHRYASTTDGAVYLVDPALATALAVDAGSFRQRRPFPARDEDVDRVRVDVRGHPSFVMTRDGDEWRLERPWHDRARSSAVRDLVESLTRLELRAFGDGGSASRVLAVVEVGVAGRTWTLELLAPTGDGAYRVRRADGSLEGTVAAWDAERLLEDPSRFLDLRLVYASNPDVLALEFRRGTNTTTLRRAAPGRPWRVGGASAAEGPGAAEMEAWLQRLRGLRATDLGPVARPLEPAGAVVLDGANRRLGTLEYRESADGPIVVRSSWRPGVILLLDASDRDALRPPSTFGGEAAP